MRGTDSVTGPTKHTKMKQNTEEDDSESRVATTYYPKRTVFNKTCVTLKQTARCDPQLGTKAGKRTRVGPSAECGKDLNTDSVCSKN